MSEDAIQAKQTYTTPNSAQKPLTPQEQWKEVESAYKNKSLFSTDKKYAGSQTLSVDVAGIFSQSDSNNDKQIDKREAATGYQSFSAAIKKQNSLFISKVLNYFGINDQNAGILASNSTKSEQTKDLATSKLGDIETAAKNLTALDSDHNGKIDYKEATNFIKVYNKASTTAKEKYKDLYQRLRAETGYVDGDFSDVKQSGEGNCWLVSSVYSLSQSKEGRQALNQDVKQNDNQTVTVTLPGIKDANGKEFTRTYSNAQIAQIIKSDSAFGDSKTFNPAMTAITMAYEDYEQITDAQRQATSGSASLKLEYNIDKLETFGSQITGGDPSGAIKLLTGCNKQELVNLNTQDIDSFLKYFEEGKHPVNGVSFKKGQDSNSDTSFKTNGTLIYSEHSYTVLSVDRTNNTITLRDPHGYTEDESGATIENNGIIVMSLDEFRTNVADGTLKDMHEKQKNEPQSPENNILIPPGKALATTKTTRKETE